MGRGFEPNGQAIYRVRTSWIVATTWKQFGPVAARVTAKRVATVVDVYDRATGEYAGAHNPHAKPRRLVAYRIGEGEWVKVAP